MNNYVPTEGGLFLKPKRWLFSCGEQPAYSVMCDLYVLIKQIHNMYCNESGCFCTQATLAK